MSFLNNVISLYFYKLNMIIDKIKKTNKLINVNEKLFKQSKLLLEKDYDEQDINKLKNIQNEIDCNLTEIYSNQDRIKKLEKDLLKIYFITLCLYMKK